MSRKAHSKSLVSTHLTGYLIYIMKKAHDETLNKFAGKHLLSIDYGTKVVGLASFAVGRDPYPLCHGRILYKDDEQVIDEILVHIEENVFDVLILGLPLYTDGNESEMTKRVRSFGEKLEEITGLPMYLQDETLSSFEAEDRMKNSPQYNFKVDLKKIDELAASIILEDFLAADKN